jgi:hypothetical protein
MNNPYIVQFHNMPICRVSANSHIRAAEKATGEKVIKSAPGNYDLLIESADGLERTYWLIKGEK